MPHPRVRRLLALWYLRRLSGFDELELTRPYVAALKVIVTDVPEPFRGRTMIGVLDYMDRTFADAEQETPRWVTALRARLSRET
jgi:hypothetical protein